MSYRKFNCTPEEAATIVATIHDHEFQPEDVVNTMFLVQRKCPWCHQPHIVTVSGTMTTAIEAINVLTNATLRVLDERLFDDDV